MCVIAFIQITKDFRGLIVRAKDVKKSLVYTPINKMFRTDFQLKRYFYFMRTQRYRLFFLWCAENDHGDEENSKVEKSIEIEQEFGYMKEKVTTIIILRR